jgi:hypothetical protein
VFDGFGLYLEVMPTGTKAWRIKFRQPNRKEDGLSFGHYPEVSLERARSRCLAARKMLDEEQDPRTEFNADRIRLPKRLLQNRPLSPVMDTRKVGHCASQVGSQAVELLHGFVFPALSRVAAEEGVRSDMQIMLKKIQKERSAEANDMLYDGCADIIVGCLELGIDEDALIETIMDARVVQRRK